MLYILCTWCFFFVLVYYLGKLYQYFGRISIFLSFTILIALYLCHINTQLSIFFFKLETVDLQDTLTTEDGHWRTEVDIYFVMFHHTDSKVCFQIRACVGLIFSILSFTVPFLFAQVLS